VTIWPPIEAPDYLPAEIREWAERHRELLELILGQFREHGAWPETKALTRRLAREGRPLDVGAAVRGMPRALGFAEGFPERAILLLFAFRLTSTAQGTLAAYIDALRFAAEKFAGEEEPPTLRRSELAARGFSSAEFLDGLSEVLFLEAPFLGSKHGAPGDEEWSAEVTSDIVRYWRATSSDRYLELRAEELRLDPVRGEAAPPAAEPSIILTSPDEVDVFLSHAGEDKVYAAELARALEARGHSVWIDQAELVVGDSLLDELNAALARCRFGLVLLSPIFFEKPWPQFELDALFALMGTGESRLLPVWHGVDQVFIAERAPLLLPRFAADSRNGIEAVASQLSAAIKRPRH
jgi:hypothetical protein